MALTIQLSEASERRLAERAAAAGTTPAEFVAGVVERELLRTQTLAELMAPVHRQVVESGMTEAEVDDFFQEVRQEVWDDWKRQGKV